MFLLKCFKVGHMDDFGIITGAGLVNHIFFHQIVIIIWYYYRLYLKQGNMNCKSFNMSLLWTWMYLLSDIQCQRNYARLYGKLMKMFEKIMKLVGNYEMILWVYFFWMTVFEVMRQLIMRSLVTVRHLNYSSISFGYHTSDGRIGWPFTS